MKIRFEEHNGQISTGKSKVTHNERLKTENKDHRVGYN